MLNISLNLNLVFNQKYLYIIYVTIAFFLNRSLYGLNPSEAFQEIRLANQELSNHYLIHEFFGYIGTFIISIILNIYQKYIFKRNLRENVLNARIQLIYNSPSQNINIFHSSKKVILIFFLTLFFAVFEEQIIDLYLNIFQDLDFWMIELFLFSYFNALMYNKIVIYAHQKFAILLSIFPILFKIMSIILSFNDNTNDKDNYTGSLPIYYKTKSFFKIPIGILIYLLFISLRSCVNLTLKWIMDYKFISHIEVLAFYSLIGTVFYLITIVVITNIKCKEIINGYNNIDYCDYLAKIKENITTNTIYYFENYKIYWSNIKKFQTIREIIIIIAQIIVLFIKKYFSLLILKDLSPSELIFTVPLSYLLQKIVSITLSLIMDNRWILTENKYKKTKIIFDGFGDIFSIIGLLIYLEIIELKFCKLDEDLKKNIANRAPLVDEENEN